MALTIVRDADPLYGGRVHAVGDLRMCHGTITFDSSYPTGGEAYTAANFGFDSHVAEIILQGTGAEVAIHDKTNKKILLFTADGTEAGDTSNQSAVVVRYIALGR